MPGRPPAYAGEPPDAGVEDAQRDPEKRAKNRDGMSRRAFTVAALLNVADALDAADTLDESNTRDTPDVSVFAAGRWHAVLGLGRPPGLTLSGLTFFFRRALHNALPNALSWARALFLGTLPRACRNMGRVGFRGRL